MLVLFVVTGAFTLTACYFRSHQPFAQVISWSRFRYLPTFFWALTGGVIVEALRSRLSTIAEVYRFRKALGIVLIAIVLLNVKYAYDQWFMWFGPKDTVAQRHQMDDDVQGAGERCTI